MPKAQPQIKDAEDSIRDIKNWVFVFAKEYDLPKEAVNMLHKKIDELAVKIGFMKCK
jgi:hypothetical protein